mmetsp:Transcript_42105/g.94667  ORF Transcript_42105/g.94667 Transcript_42105/m.94667 type:complete len:233 (-) Transcript_42105:16-714(-)
MVVDVEYGLDPGCAEVFAVPSISELALQAQVQITVHMARQHVATLVIPQLLILERALDVDVTIVTPMMPTNRADRNQSLPAAQTCLRRCWSQTTLAIQCAEASKLSCWQWSVATKPDTYRAVLCIDLARPAAEGLHRFLVAARPDTRAIIAVPACLATEPVGVPINSMSAASRPYTQRPWKPQVNESASETAILALVAIVTLFAAAVQAQGKYNWRWLLRRNNLRVLASHVG